MHMSGLLLRKNWQLYIVMIALVGLVCSYQPLLQLGNIAGTYIDISLSYTLVGVAILTSLPVLWRHRATLYNSPIWLLLLVLVTYIAISTVWSPNPIRGSIIGIFWFAVLALVSIVVLYAETLLKQQKNFLRLTSIAYKLVIVWAIWQLVADTLNIPALYSLLPAAYSGDVFGFARPTGFALEPQFLGSLLLVPFAWLTYKLFSKRHDIYHCGWYVVILSMLLMTLSRGALLSMVVITLVLVISTRPSARAIARYCGAAALGIVCTLVIMFGTATLRTHDKISGAQAVSRAINHLTLGASNINTSRVDSSGPGITTAHATAQNPKNGYVSSSTTSRVSQAQEAISVWGNTPATIIFGVGAGGFGLASTANLPGAVVNNYYLELLAENGLVGIGIFAVILSLLFAALIRHKQWLLVALLAGLFSQALFFSGNANILHIWALVGLALGQVSRSKNTKRLLQ